MGAWGAGILENDSTVDYLIYINALWNLKFEKNKIQGILQKKFLQDGDNALNYDIDRYTEVWTAIGFAEWLYDKPSKEVIRKIEKIINSNQEFDTWVEPKERMQCIEKFLEVLQTPRPQNEKRLWKIWFWENSTNITDNSYAESLIHQFDTLSRMGIKNRIEILLDNYLPLTRDLEEPIFWGTIGKCEIEIDEIKLLTQEKIAELYDDTATMHVITVAYNENHRNRIVESLKERRFEK